MKMSNKVYDWLKWIAQVILPAAATLYAAVGAVVPLPWVTEVVGILSAVDVFLGSVLGISSNAYYKSQADT